MLASIMRQRLATSQISPNFGGLLFGYFGPDICADCVAAADGPGAALGRVGVAATTRWPPATSCDVPGREIMVFPMNAAHLFSVLIRNIRALVLSTDQEHSRACYILDRQYQNTHTYQTQTKDSMKMHDDYSEGQSVNLYFRSAAPDRTSKEF